MRWSLKIGKIADIGIFLHWTFLLLIAWIMRVYMKAGNDWNTALIGFGFILAIFVCVTFHELGHALAARWFNIATQDITVYPIAGVPQMTRIPEKPRQEIWVALAGPAVSIMIALALFVVVQFLANAAIFPKIHPIKENFWAKLMWVNIIIAIFNLLPAFPMDGGRMLRAFLSMRMDYVRATQTTANIGQTLAIGFGVLGFFYNCFFLFIAMFIYLGAEGEGYMAKMKVAFKGIPVRQAMVTHFRTVNKEDSLSIVVEELLNSAQEDFPVMGNGEIMGIITRSDLLKALAEGRKGSVNEFMRRNCPPIDEKDMLESTFQRMQAGGCHTLPVMREGQLVGLATLQNIGEWMMVQSALYKDRAHSEVSDISNPN